MCRLKCIVKTSESVVNMGSMDVLCTDKTGTLTQDTVQLSGSVNTQGEDTPLPLRWV